MRRSTHPTTVGAFVANAIAANAIAVNPIAMWNFVYAGISENEEVAEQLIFAKASAFVTGGRNRNIIENNAGVVTLRQPTRLVLCPGHGSFHRLRPADIYGAPHSFYRS